MEGSFDVVRPVLEFARQHGGHLRVQIRRTQFVRQTLDVAGTNFTHFGLSKRDDFLRLDAVTGENFTQCVCRFSGGHHVVDHHEMTARLQQRQGVQSFGVRRVETHRFTDFTDATFFRGFGHRQRRGPAGHHGAAEPLG